MEPWFSPFPLFFVLRNFWWNQTGHSLTGRGKGHWVELFLLTVDLFLANFSVNVLGICLDWMGRRWYGGKVQWTEIQKVLFRQFLAISTCHPLINFLGTTLKKHSPWLNYLSRDNEELNLNFVVGTAPLSKAQTKQQSNLTQRQVRTGGFTPQFFNRSTHRWGIDLRRPGVTALVHRSARRRSQLGDYGPGRQCTERLPCSLPPNLQQTPNFQFLAHRSCWRYDV